MVLKKTVKIKVLVEAVVPENWEELPKERKLSFIKTYIDNGRIVQIINLN